MQQKINQLQLNMLHLSYDVDSAVNGQSNLTKMAVVTIMV